MLRWLAVTRYAPLLALAGCWVYYAPKTIYPLPEPRLIVAPADSLWPAVIDVVNEHQLTVKLLDRASGFVQSERMWAGGGSTWWDCGERTQGGYREWIADLRNIPVVVTITVLPRNSRETHIRVTSNVGSTLTENGTAVVVARCRSKGVFEAGLLDAIASRASGR